MTGRSLRKVLVTGGASFIGSSCWTTCLRAFARICRVFRSSSSRRHSRSRCDSPGDGGLRHGVSSCRVCGERASIDNPIQDSEINVLGTLRVLEIARESGVEKIVSSSSAGIFGELKTLPIREDHPIEPDTPYGASKLAGEKLCLAYAKLYPIECVCVRYFNVYGVH